MERRILGLIADFLHWPRRAIVLCRWNTAITGALTQIHDATQDFGYMVQTDNTDGSEWSNGFLLRPGTYTMSVLGMTQGNFGKIDFYIDDVAVVTGQDWYSAGTVQNVSKTATVQITGPSPYHVLRGKTNGKNASSSAFFTLLTAIAFYPATD